MAVFGHTVKGPTNIGSGAFNISSFEVTGVGVAGTTSSIHAYVINDDGVSVHNVLLAVYADSSGFPGNQLATEVSIEVPASFDGEISAAYEVTLVAETKYWMAWMTDDNDMDMWYTGGTSDIQAFGAEATFNLIDPFPGSSTFDNRFNIWVTYSAGGGDIVVLRRRRSG